MKNKLNARPRSAAVLACALLIACAAAGPALAQTAAVARPAKARPATAASAKPATTAKRAASVNTTVPQSDYWSVSSDLGNRYSDAAAVANDRIPRPTSTVGRVPLQTGPGSFGLSTSQTKAGQFSDGQTVPGLESGARRGSDGYVGLSLSVPSFDKNLAIPPPPTPWNRIE